MHAFALPGLSQMPCENATSTPVLLFCTDAGSLCISSFVEHNVGCWGFCCCWACAFLYYLSPPLLSAIHPNGWGKEKWGGGSREILRRAGERWGRGLNELSPFEVCVLWGRVWKLKRGKGRGGGG